MKSRPLQIGGITNFHADSIREITEYIAGEFCLTCQTPSLPQLMICPLSPSFTVDKNPPFMNKESTNCCLNSPFSSLQMTYIAKRQSTYMMSNSTNGSRNYRPMLVPPRYRNNGGHNRTTHFYGHPKTEHRQTRSLGPPPGMTNQEWRLVKVERFFNFLVQQKGENVSGFPNLGKLN